MKCLPKDCIIARYLGTNCRMLFRYNHDRLNSLHSFNDQPSMVGLNGTIFYHKNDLRHRGYDKPAIIFNNKKKEWWIEGKPIREGKE